MVLPRYVGSPASGSGHGPFGEKAFKRALIGSVALVVIGVALVLTGGEAATALGASFLALAAVGWASAGAGLLLERLLHRRPPPPEEVRMGNGHGPRRPIPRPPDVSGGAGESARRRLPPRT